LHALREHIFKDVEHLQLPFTSVVFVWSDEVLEVLPVLCI